MSIELAIEEVQQKIGRNLMAVQRMELNLKKLSYLGGVSGSTDTLQQNWERHSSKVSTSTLGGLATRYISMHNDETTEQVTKCAQITTPTIHLSFHFENNERYIIERKVALNRVVKERNWLVHNFLEDYALDSVGNCELASKALDEQYCLITAELEHIRNDAKGVSLVASAALNLIQSGEISRISEIAILNSNPLTTSFMEVLKEYAQPDGWCSLSVASKIVKTRLPGEYANLKVNTGYKTIKSFLMATTSFEFNEMMTDKKTIVLMYRLSVS